MPKGQIVTWPPLHIVPLLDTFFAIVKLDTKCNLEIRNLLMEGLKKGVNKKGIILTYDLKTRPFYKDVNIRPLQNTIKFGES